MTSALTRRRLNQLAVAWLAVPPLAAAVPVSAQARPANARRPLPSMTEGPFYPTARWRGTDGDWDADLTTVTQLGQSRTARGQHMGLQLQVIDTDGRPLDAVDCEIWQCDAHAVYRHPAQAGMADRADAGFQGFGAARSNGEGRVSFRTIQPVPYPGRTPHIHFKLRHPQFGELTSQLFVAGEPGNAADGLWRRLSPQGQAALAMQLSPATEGGLRWQASHVLVVPA